jgi:hypothetical protein
MGERLVGARTVGFALADEATLRGGTFLGRPVVETLDGTGGFAGRL